MKFSLNPAPSAALFRQSCSGHSGNGVFSADFETKCEKCKIGFHRKSEFVLENGQAVFIRNGYEEVVSLWNSRTK